MCKHCSVIVECKEKKQRKVVADAIKTQMDQILKANITEKIPAEILERVLKRALDFCDDPTTLMQNLDTIQIGDEGHIYNGHIYNCGEVLRELVNGSGNIPGAILKEEPSKKENWFDTVHCKSGKHCKYCRTSRKFREDIRRLWKVDPLDFYCQSEGIAYDNGGDCDIGESLTVETPPIVEAPPLDEAVCVNNTGMGDSFDVGVTYIFDKHEEEDMLWVTDNLGTRREVLKERFKLPPEEKKERITRNDSEDRDSDFADIPF
jgi:hypothetical protein